MQENEDSSFIDEVDGVTPLSQDKLIISPKAKNINQANANRRKSALQVTSPFENFLSDGTIDFVEPNALLRYKKDGVQPNVFKNLQQGKYAFDYHLDLHNKTIEQARSLIFELLSSAKTEDFRSFKITHGKGTLSKQPAKLKSYVNHWLRQIEQVIAFHSALPQHGGTGSLYVLLKKQKGERKINQIKYD